MAGPETGQGAQIVIRPQPGPQTTFLASPADIAIYGGSAGGGKSWGLLMEPLRHVHNPQFGGVIFRRTTVQVRNEGGLWDESAKLYPLVGADPKEHELYWRFPAGSNVAFAHLEHDKTVLNWQGYLFGNGAIGYAEATGDGGPKKPVEIASVASAGNGEGIETVWYRRHWVMHPRGVAFSGTPAAAAGVTDTELATGTNWTRVYDPKLVRMVAVVTNG